MKVTDAKSKKGLSKVYVKVFARKHGRSGFYKDGYTDLRGKFDYATKSDGDLAGIDKFAILVVS